MLSRFQFIHFTFTIVPTTSVLRTENRKFVLWNIHLKFWVILPRKQTSWSALATLQMRRKLDELTFAGTWKTNGQIADRLDLSLIFVLSQLKDAIRRKSCEVIKVALDYKRDESTENKSDCLQQDIPVGRK